MSGPAGVVRRVSAQKLAESMVRPIRCGGLDYVSRGPEEQIAALQLRIVEYEKYTGPIAAAMIDNLKRQIDQIRAKTRR